MTTSWLYEWRNSRSMVLCIVTAILMLDNLFSLMAAPILPKILLWFQFKDTSITEANFWLLDASAKFREIGRHQSLMDDSMLVAIIIAGKSAVQIISNPMLGLLTYEFGYSVPIFFAFVLLFFSTFIFAIGQNFIVLLLSRLLQGVASSCARVAGFGVLAVKYTDDDERGYAMTVALGGMAFGMLFGPILGGSLFDIMGKAPMFLFLCLPLFIGGFVQLMMIRPDVSLKAVKEDQVSLLRLFKDPYILMTTGGLFVGNVVFAVIEASLPIWMTDSMHASNTELGAAFIPTFSTYLISIYLILPFCWGMEKWCRAMIGILMLGFSVLALPMSKNFNGIILPTVLAGFGKSLVDSSLMPELAHFMDVRYSSVYGNVYAISDMATSLGYIIGPMISGTIMSTFGFSWLMVFVAVLCLVFAPMLFFLRHSRSIAEQEALLKRNGYSGNSYG